MKRVFIALDVSRQAREAISRHIAALRKEVPDVKASWVRSDNLHITLKFFGEIENSRVDDVMAIATEAAKTAKPFTLRLSHCGNFGPRVLYVGIKDREEAVSRLFQSVEREAAARGFPPERRSFNSHITVARLRSELAARQLVDSHKMKQIEAVEFAVNELVVYESRLNSTGSVYLALGRYRFGG